MIAFLSKLFGVPSLGGIAVYLAVTLGLAGTAFWQGIEIEADHRDARDKKAQDAALVVFHRQEIALNIVSVNLERKLDGFNVAYAEITRTVDRIVDRAVYRNVCFDDDGLRAANAALTGAPLDPGEPDAAMSSPHAP